MRRVQIVRTPCPRCDGPREMQIDTSRQDPAWAFLAGIEMAPGDEMRRALCLHCGWDGWGRFSPGEANDLTSAYAPAAA